jgi:hypothetical protein
MRPVSVMGRHQGIKIIQRYRRESATRITILSRLRIIKFRRTGTRSFVIQRGESELILLTIPNRFSIFPGNLLNHFRLIHQEDML